MARVMLIEMTIFVVILLVVSTGLRRDADRYRHLLEPVLATYF